jgi:hypothetical protein
VKRSESLGNVFGYELGDVGEFKRPTDTCREGLALTTSSSKILLLTRESSLSTLILVSVVEEGSGASWLLDSNLRFLSELEWPIRSRKSLASFHFLVCSQPNADGMIGTAVHGFAHL